METNFDVLIVGAGCVGSTLALALSRAGVRVGLVEAREPRLQWDEDSVDLRVYAITHASRNIFAGLGVWDAIASDRVSPYGEMLVWDSAGNGRVRFDSAEIGEPQLGFIVEERVIQRALTNALAKQRGLTRVCPARVETCQPLSEGGYEVRLEDGRTFTAPLLVGADGARSQVRGLCGIATQRTSYQQSALVCVVETERSHEQVARQRFLATGPLAFLPLADGRCSIVWSTSPERAEELLAMEEAAFRQALGEAFDHTLGDITAIGERVTFPLTRMHAKEYVRAGLALVGDAAHSIHPLAGQGVNLGLLDAAALAQVVIEARDERRNYASLRNLRRYERWRRGDNQLTQLTMDGFKELFGSRLPLLRWGRNLGLNLVDELAPVKNLFARHAMGVGRDLPDLAGRPPQS